MIVVGGNTTDGTINVLANTEIQTLYRKSMVEVYASTFADADRTGAQPVCDYKSGKITLVDTVRIANQLDKAYKAPAANTTTSVRITALMQDDCRVFSGMVPPGQQQLKFPAAAAAGATVHWAVAVHDA